MAVMMNIEYDVTMNPIHNLYIYRRWWSDEAVAMERE